MTSPAEPALPDTDKDSPYACAHKDGCSLVVVYVPESQRKSITEAWQHADGSRGHFVAPVPRCPDCGSTHQYAATDTMWGINRDCKRCGYHSYFSLGD